MRHEQDEADAARAIGKAMRIELPRWDAKGVAVEQWPEDLRVRQFLTA